MSFWKKLFGGGGGESGRESGGAAPSMGQEDYKGFSIRAVQMMNGREFQLAGVIEKDGKSHEFVRADRFGSRDEAAQITLAKGRQIIDEQGDRLFDQNWPRASH